MNRDALIRSLALIPDVLEGFLAGLEDGELDRDRGGGLWTIREHAAHLALVQPMLYARMECFRDEMHPVMVPYEPEGEDSSARKTADIAETQARFRSWRERQVELLDGLEAAVWVRDGRHPEYERYNLDILAAHTYFHDGFHLYRIEETALVKDGGLTTLP